MPSRDSEIPENDARPYAYRTGRVEFFYLPFRSDERALVPRLETESLVREALSILRSEPYGTVVDVGTGSGVIAVSIAKNRRDLRVLAVDAHAAPLSLARENALANGIRVECFQSDLLSGLSDDALLAPAPADGPDRISPSPGAAPGILFLANLPYVREGASDLSPDTAYEPREALFGGPETGFELTRRFLGEIEAFSRRHPDVPVRVACEVGDDHAEEIAAVAADFGREVRTFPDLLGVRRFFTYRIWPS